MVNGLQRVFAPTEALHQTQVLPTSYDVDCNYNDKCLHILNKLRIRLTLYLHVKDKCCKVVKEHSAGATAQNPKLGNNGASV